MLCAHEQMCVCAHMHVCAVKRLSRHKNDMGNTWESGFFCSIPALNILLYQMLTNLNVNLIPKLSQCKEVELCLTKYLFTSFIA